MPPLPPAGGAALRQAQRTVGPVLVRPGEDRALVRPLTGEKTDALAFVRIQRETADGRLRFFFDVQLILTCAGPMRADEAALSFQHFLELVVALHAMSRIG